ncbi:hypothetical protein [Streptomyces sp. NPDC020362]|uniref:hypothetical protein n=1 Tax=unclassified Streptomyces TaxID=2593676 RepID=UPI000AA40902
MAVARDAAAEKPLQAAIERKVARRSSEEGWQQELARRDQVTCGPQITTVTIHADGSTTSSEPRPWQMSCPGTDSYRLASTWARAEEPAKAG